MVKHVFVFIKYKGKIWFFFLKKNKVIPLHILHLSLNATAICQRISSVCSSSKCLWPQVTTFFFTLFKYGSLQMLYLFFENNTFHRDRCSVHCCTICPTICWQLVKRGKINILLGETLIQFLKSVSLIFCLVQSESCHNSVFLMTWKAGFGGEKTWIRIVQFSKTWNNYFHFKFHFKIIISPIFTHLYLLVIYILPPWTLDLVKYCLQDRYNCIVN